jgi:uncharacterized membrane protein
VSQGTPIAATPPTVLIAPPSRVDATVARATYLLGGPWGRYAAASRFWSPLRLMLAFGAFTLVAAYVQKSPCASGQWTGNLQYTHACYSDVVPLWSAEGLDVGAVPYRDHAVEYPVLTGGFMWFSAILTHIVHAVITASWVEIFGAVTCLLLAICGLAAIAGTVGAAGRRPYDAAIFALSPLLVFHAYSNWDLLAMAFASCALWAWSRQRPIATGILIGLGTAAKLYPVFLLVALAILAIRTRRYRELTWCTLAAIAIWCAVNLPVRFAYFSGWWKFYQFSTDRPTEASTFWAMANYLRTIGFFGNGYAPSWVPPGIAVALVFLIAMAAVVFVGLWAPTRPRLGQLAFLVVLAFLLTTKVWSPQYSLWLVPLLALARPRWRMNLVWQFSEIAVWIATLLWLLGFNDSNHGLDYGWLMITLLIRDALLIALAVLVIREMWRPELDIVRSGGLDDPAGGIFDGAPDVPNRIWQIGRRPERSEVIEVVEYGDGIDDDDMSTSPDDRAAH